MFVLIHSPLVGPGTWQPVAQELRREKYEVAVPELQDNEDVRVAYWQQHAESVRRALSAVPVDRRLILAGHSGAGPLLPVIRQSLRHQIDAYMFVDAGIPQRGASRLDQIAAESPDWFQSFSAFLAEGGRFPDWRDEDLLEEIPDQTLRHSLLAELRPRALPFWEESIPVFEGWPDAPCAYLHFSAAYNGPAAVARDRGWSYIHLPGGHFLLMVDPQIVARGLISMLPDLGIDQTNLNEA